jgi:pilus assembly protein CpaE
MSAAALARTTTAAVPKGRDGIIAVVHDEVTLEAVQGIVRESQLDDELILEDTLDAALQRVRAGAAPRILLLDITGSTDPIVEMSAARSVGGTHLKILGLGTVNDVALFRDLLSAGADDYLAKPVDWDALAAALARRTSADGGPGTGGLGEVVAVIGSRGGIGTTTTAVSCAWLLSEQQEASTVLLDLDLHFGTVALQLDIDPGSGLTDGLEQPSRIDAAYVEQAVVEVSETLSVLATEAAVAETLTIEAGAIDMLLFELRRKFAWVIVDLPRCITPAQRAVLGAASRVVVLCERSLAGLRDTMRLQKLVGESAPQAQIFLLDCAGRAAVPKAEFEKAIGQTLDGTLSYDAVSAGLATHTGKPLPTAAPKSPTVREIKQLVAALTGPDKAPKRGIFGFSRR